jgi:tetratricopeptide (TPR) repeat protein
MPPVEIKGMTITANGTGLRLTGTAAKISASNFIRNKDAIVADAFSGEIRDNNFLDNDSNIQAEKLLTVAPNWFGTVESEELKLENVSASQVYDGRVPGGVVVRAITDPYLRMTSEERRMKGAELLVEAGNYFRQRNYGKAMLLFAEDLRVDPCAESYYYLSLCHQEMKEQDQALEVLRQGTAKFPHDPMLWKSFGMLLYEKGEEAEARKALEEVLRLSPEDRQARFVMERLKTAQ